MKIFFTQEIKRIPRPPSAFDDSTFWGRLVLAMDEMQRQNTLRPTPFPTRAKAFEYWLSLLPLWRQKVLLLELCSKPDFPMGRGKPTEQQRAGPTALLNNFVIDDLVILGLQVLDSAHVNTMWQKALARCLGPRIEDRYRRAYPSSWQTTGHVPASCSGKPRTSNPCRALS
jgi:hypothetical protein